MAAQQHTHTNTRNSLECVTGDLVALLDHLGHETAVFIGHDWGGLTVWAMALHHASRVTAVASVCAPLVPYFPVNPMEHMRQRPGRFAYQVLLLLLLLLLLARTLCSSSSSSSSKQLVDNTCTVARFTFSSSVHPSRS